MYRGCVEYASGMWVLSQAPRAQPHIAWNASSPISKYMRGMPGETPRASGWSCSPMALEYKVPK